MEEVLFVVTVFMDYSSFVMTLPAPGGRAVAEEVDLVLLRFGAHIAVGVGVGV